MLVAILVGIALLVVATKCTNDSTKACLEVIGCCIMILSLLAIIAHPRSETTTTTNYEIELISPDVTTSNDFSVVQVGESYVVKIRNAKTDEFKMTEISPCFIMRDDEMYLNETITKYHKSNGLSCLMGTCGHEIDTEIVYILHIPDDVEISKFNYDIEVE